MQMLAQELKPMPETKSASSVKPAGPFSGQSHEVTSLLYLQRTIGNYAVQRLLQANAEELETASAPNASARFGQDFRRTPAFPRHAATGYRFLSDEEMCKPEAHGDFIALRQGYPGAAPPAAPAWGPGVPPVLPGPAPVPTPTPAPACTITSRTTAPAPDGTPDTRTTIGVCETVEFDAGGDVVDWSANMGSPRAEAGKAKLLWAAPEGDGTATITATRPGAGATCTLDLKVVRPTTVQYKKKSDLTIPPGDVGAGMKLEGTILPLNVTFGWIDFKEDVVPATNVTGYFRRLRRQGISLRHEPPDPNKVDFDFKRVGWDNTFCCDMAVLSGPWPRPSRGGGAFEWVIPNSYRCEWSTGTGRLFDHTTQSFTIDAWGTVTVTKGGESASHTP
jgi:hypothetical protein